MDRIERILNNFQQSNRDALIPMLQAIQDEFGVINEEALQKMGEHLDLPSSKIYGLATFYNQFTFETKGKYHIRICNGSACHLDHSDSIIKEIFKQLGVNDGETTRDGMFSLELVACIGACGQSPVIEINGQYFPRMKASGVKEVLENIRLKHK